MNKPIPTIQIQPNNNIVFENAEIVVRNIAGIAKQYNDAGKRNFVVLLLPEHADVLKQAGVNIRVFNKRAVEEEDEAPIFCAKVNVNMNSNRPPVIELISSKGVAYISDPTSCIMFDNVILDTVHFEVSLYRAPNSTSTTLYLQQMKATMVESYLDMKYGNQVTPEIDD